MQVSIVFSSACTMSSWRKFTFAISSPGEFLVIITWQMHSIQKKIIRPRPTYKTNTACYTKLQRCELAPTNLTASKQHYCFTPSIFLSSVLNSSFSRPAFSVAPCPPYIQTDMFVTLPCVNRSPIGHDINVYSLWLHCERRIITLLRPAEVSQEDYMFAPVLLLTYAL